MDTSNIERLQSLSLQLQSRAKSTIYTSAALGLLFGLIAGVLCSISATDLTIVDYAVFGFVGAMFGRLLGASKQLDLNERVFIIQTQLELMELKTEVPETRPAPTGTVSEAVAKVEIPAEPKLPVIPSVAAPAEVKEALKAAKGKAKGKPTKLPPKQRKPKTVPPAQA